MESIKDKINFLKEKANKIRILSLKSIYYAKSGHPGGSLSIADILAVLYFYKMNFKTKDLNWEKRDRFILSKGHSCPALYSVFAILGFFPYDELLNLRKPGSILPGHPEKNITPGIEVPSGSLGLGFGAAAGIAKGLKLKKINSKVYVLLGDGECEEGIVWETAMFSNHHKLSNLIAIIDRNYLQSDNNTENIISLGPLDKKFNSFGWNVHTINGHNISEIISVLDRTCDEKNKPTCIIAKTIKGKGVPFMENVPKWHGSLAPDNNEMKIAMEALGEKWD